MPEETAHGGAIYSATKYSVRVISEVLRKEVKPYNIRTTILSPGAVDTELPKSVGAEDVSEWVSNFYKEYAIPCLKLRSVHLVRYQPARGGGR